MLAVGIPFILAPTLILIIATNPADASSQYKYITLYLLPQLIAVITGAIMGFEVNRKVKRVDLLQGGLKNFMVIWKAYYQDIVRHKRFPIVFILFMSSIVFVIGEYLWILYCSKGVMGIILLAVVVFLLSMLGHFSKRYNIENFNDKK